MSTTASKNHRRRRFSVLVFFFFFFFLVSLISSLKRIHGSVHRGRHGLKIIIIIGRKQHSIFFFFFVFFDFVFLLVFVLVVVALGVVIPHRKRPSRCEYLSLRILCLLSSRNTRSASLPVFDAFKKTRTNGKKSREKITFE